MLRIDPITGRTLQTAARIWPRGGTHPKSTSAPGRRRGRRRRRSALAGTVIAGAFVAASLGSVHDARGAVSAIAAASLLTVTGDAADDSIVISCDAGNVAVAAVVIAPPVVACNTVSVINVVGGGGADTIDLQGVLASDFTILTNPVTVNAGEGNDTVTGSGIATTRSRVKAETICC